ncbi:MAG: ATPase domain-containing protein [Candidatus Helarchaeota archaeon]
MDKDYFPTGCSCIDGLLGKGFESQTITHIYGESGTGKSIIALQCAYNAALKGLMTFYIDTEKAFSATRLKQIAKDNFSKVGKLIFVYSPSKYRQQIKIVEKLEKFLTEKSKLIIIDTISSLFSAEIGNNTKKNYKLNKLLNHQLAELTRLAEQYNLAVIVTNQVRTRFSSENNDMTVPINKNILEYWSKVQLYLTYPEKRDLTKRQAFITKHSDRKTDKNCFFYISNEGCK